MGISETWLEPHLPTYGGVAVDVGANHGGWTRELARRFDAVYAVEPNPALHDELGTCGENVAVLGVGAWSEAGECSFHTYAQDAHMSAVFEVTGINTGAAIGEVTLPCLPLDEMPIEGRVDFIKIDVEGAERHVLAGACETIRHDRPSLIVEVHVAHYGALLERVLRAWCYEVEIVRHPLYAEGSDFWLRHYWLVANPL